MYIVFFKVVFYTHLLYLFVVANKYLLTYLLIRLIACQDNCSPDFTLTEVRQAVSELKSGKCVDPMGYIREVFINSGDGLLLYLLDMINVIKKSKIIPLEWSEMWIKTLKKKKGSYKTLNNYRGIFIVPIISVIFEKLIKNRIMDTDCKVQCLISRMVE